MQYIVGHSHHQKNDCVTAGNPGGLLKILDKYSEACQTLLDFPSFRKMILDMLAIIFLKLGKSNYVWQASEYLSKIFKRPPGLLAVTQSIFWWWECPTMYCKLKNVYLFLKFGKSNHVMEASRYFSWFLRVPSLIASMSKIIFLKLGKSNNVWQASEYFSKIFKRPPGLLAVTRSFFWWWECPTMYCKSKEYLYMILKHAPGLVPVPRSSFWSLDSPTIPGKLQNIFLWYLKCLLVW